MNFPSHRPSKNLDIPAKMGVFASPIAIMENWWDEKSPERD